MQIYALSDPVVLILMCCVLSLAQAVGGKHTKVEPSPLAVSSGRQHDEQHTMQVGVCVAGWGGGCSHCSSRHTSMSHGSKFGSSRLNASKQSSIQCAPQASSVNVTPSHGQGARADPGTEPSTANKCARRETDWGRYAHWAVSCSSSQREMGVLTASALCRCTPRFSLWTCRFML
jgi:hypothetical protein